MHLLRWCSWVFGLGFFGYYFISSIIIFKVQDAYVLIYVFVTLDARGCLAWTSLGIILFLRSLYSKFRTLGLLWVLFYFFDHYIQSSGRFGRQVSVTDIYHAKLRSVAPSSAPWLINHIAPPRLANGKASLDPLRSVQFSVVQSCPCSDVGNPIANDAPHSLRPYRDHHATCNTILHHVYPCLAETCRGLMNVDSTLYMYDLFLNCMFPCFKEMWQCNNPCGVDIP